MARDLLAADLHHVVQRRAEPDRLHDRRRAGLEAVRRLAIGDAVDGHALDHRAAAQEWRQLVEQRLFSVEHADAARPVELVAGHGVEIAVERPARRRSCAPPPAHRRRIPGCRGRARSARSPRSARPCRARSTCASARSSSCAWSAAPRTPRAATRRVSEIGAHFSTAPFRSRRKCHGTMLEWCSMIDSTISSPGLMLSWPQA